MEEAVPVNVLSAALCARYRSRVDHTFGDKILSAMRLGFGGHVEVPQQHGADAETNIVCLQQSPWTEVDLDTSISLLEANGAN